MKSITKQLPDLTKYLDFHLSSIVGVLFIVWQGEKIHFFSEMTSSSYDAARINQYDSKTYTRNRINTRVVVREKPFVKSRSQRLMDWLRPSQRPGHSVIETMELLKVMGCIVFPVFALAYWKYYQQHLPDDWESKFHNLQHKQFKEDAVEAKSTDYFSIIDGFQERRAQALLKKQNGGSTTS